MSWDNLKAGVAAVIKDNGNKEITGQALQNVLNAIINNLGANATFAGFAIPTTSPGVPDGPVFYLSTIPGRYSNFNNLELPDNSIGIFTWTGETWNLNSIQIGSDLGSTDDLEEGQTNLYFTPQRAQTALSGHTGDNNIHVTLQEKTNWNNKGTYSKPQGGIPESDLSSDMRSAIDTIASCVNNGYYDSNAKKILLKHNTTTIVQIDATDFIKDGMISNVVIQDGYIVITFNTDSGKEPIALPISAIFNPDNYYTKSAINQLLAAKQDTIQDLATIRSGASSGATAYQKPQDGIPKLDLKPSIQNTLDGADELYEELHDKLETSWPLSPSDENFPSTKLVKDTFNSIAPKSQIGTGEGQSYSDDEYASTKAVKDYVDTEALSKEEAETTYAKQDGYYEPLGVGEAKNIIGQIPQDAGFIYRTAGGSSEIADGLSTVKKIQGNVVSWNQKLRRNTQSVFTDKGVTFTYYSDGTVVANGTATGDIWTAQPFYNITSIVGHRYLLLGGIDSTHSLTDGNGFLNDLGNGSYKKATSTSQIKICVVMRTGATADNLVFKPQLFDITLIYGAGKEPTTVAQFKADYQRWFGKPLTYEPYNAGTLIPMKMQGIKTVGFNQYNPTTGIVKGLVVDGGYQITGAYTSITQDGEEIVPDADDIFRITKAGDIVVNGGDDTTCVHLAYDDERNGEYEPYKEHNYAFDVTRVWGKLNGEGSYVQIAPDGLKSDTPINNSSDLQNAIADSIEFGEDGVTADIKVGGVNLGSLNWTPYDNSGEQLFQSENVNNLLATSRGGKLTVTKSYTTEYSTSWSLFTGNSAINKNRIGAFSNKINIYDSAQASSTGAQFKAAMQGVPLYYQLATPLHYTDLMLDTSVAGDGSQLEPITNIRPIVDNYGTEEIIVPESQDSVPSSCNPWMSIQYDINAAEHIDTFEKHGIKDVALHDNLQALCNVINTNCSEQLGGTINISAEPNDNLVYSFTFTEISNTVVLNATESGGTIQITSVTGEFPPSQYISNGKAKFYLMYDNALIPLSVAYTGSINAVGMYSPYASTSVYIVRFSGFYGDSIIGTTVYKEQIS